MWGRGEIVAADCRRAMIFFGILIGIVISGAIIILSNRYVSVKYRSEAEARRKSRLGNSVTPLKIRVAMIAQDLMPLFAQLKIDASSTIDVIAADGLYLDSGNGHLLRNGIKDWIQKGASVNYFLLHSSDQALDKFLSIAREFPDKFKVYRLDQERCPSGVSEIVSEFETLHPTIVTGSGVEAMWLEKNHPLRSRYAFDVVYYPPFSVQNGEGKAEFVKYRDKILKLKAVCEPVPVSETVEDQVRGDAA